MFTGHYTHNLDSKWRLTIPASFKNDLRSGLALTPGPSGCVFVYTMEAWEEIAVKLKALPDTLENRALKRYTFSKTQVEFNLEKAGRVLLPEPLREHTGIQKTVVIVGDNERLEIWAAERWAELTANDAAGFDTAYESLAAQGLL